MPRAGTPSDNPKLTIIQALLAKAADKGVTDEEREAYMAKADALMQKYSIDALTLAAAEGKKSTDVVITKVLMIDVPGMYSYEYTVMAIRIAEAFNGRGLISSLTRGKKAPYIIAYQSDMDLILAMVESLARQCTFALATWSKVHGAGYVPGNDLYRAKKDFINAFTRAISVRLLAIRNRIVEEAKVTGNGMELVLVDRKAALDAAYAESRTGVGRGRSYGSSNAGSAAGHAADIGQGALGSGRQALGR